jgi:hypothetical protein
MAVFVADEADDGGCIDENAGRLFNQMIQCVARRPRDSQVYPSAHVFRMDPRKFRTKIGSDILIRRLICGEYVLATYRESVRRFDYFPEMRFWAAAYK